MVNSPSSQKKIFQQITRAILWSSLFLEVVGILPFDLLLKAKKWLPFPLTLEFPHLMNFVYSVGMLLCLLGIGLQAFYKKRSAAWCLLGLVPVIGPFSGLHMGETAEPSLKQ